MKKIIVAITMLALTTFSVKAIELPAFTSNLSLTGGLAMNQGVFGASAKETNRSDTDTIASVKKEHGVFTDSYSSQFIELNIGDWVSLGYEHTPDSISTPQNTSRGGLAGKTTVSVDFNDLDTYYVKLNLPYINGFYVKAGTVETSLDIKETVASGRKYKNVSTEGEVYGLGYDKALGETRFTLRFETSYLELDNVNTNNGVAIGDNTIANGGQNRIDASNMEGLQGKVALTFTLGGNR